MMVHDTENAQTSIISGIYVPAQSRDKQAFWEHLTQLSSILDIPWCLVGDFNDLETPSDKKGGLPPHTHSFARLTKFLSDINATSLHVSGNCFTWKKILGVFGNNSFLAKKSCLR